MSAAWCLPPGPSQGGWQDGWTVPASEGVGHASHEREAWWGGDGPPRDQKELPGAARAQRALLSSSLLHVPCKGLEPITVTFSCSGHDNKNACFF